MSITTGLELSSIGSPFSPSSAPPTLNLPPQTTPFTPPASADCRQSVYCPYLTYWVYARSPDLRGMPCTAVDRLGADAVGYNPACLPDGYFSLFPYEILTSVRESSPEPPESATLAFDGGACPSGWSTACTTAVAPGASQAWCCPPGAWGCADVPGRFCTSVLADSTDVWMTWDPAFTDPAGDEFYTWTAGVQTPPSASPATVYRRVFPLQLTEKSGDPTAAAGNSSLGNGTRDESGGSKSVLGTGAKAGIGAAAGAVGVGAVVAGVLLLVRRRRQRDKGGSDEGEVVGAAPDGHAPPGPPGNGFGDKPELEGTSVTPASRVIPKAELNTGTAGRGQLEQNVSRVGSGAGSGSQGGTVSPLGTLSPNPTGNDGIFPSPDSRHKSVFEMSG
ncbi:hypothetical protein GGR52DRAFT_524319 [Hypoxylon sp. FL1284]|nr:hypothetical protein GGR52DRAFT_524319 [Hypoxylon sp. FL1284]